jgi:hypothetical protein
MRTKVSPKTVKGLKIMLSIKANIMKVLEMLYIQGTSLAVEPKQIVARSFGKVLNMK